MIFLIVATATFFPITWYTHVDAITTEATKEIRSDMTSAAFDAMKAVNMKDDHAFKTKAERSEALDAFYTSLASAYGLPAAGGLAQNQLTSHIPFVALIDNDGVYVSYDKDYNTWGNTDKHTYKITPITTFSENYTISKDEQYIIQFELNGSATVYYNGIKLCNGTYKEIKKDLEDIKAKNKDGKNAIDNIHFLATEDLFDIEKQVVVTNVITRTVENYMNKEIASNQKTFDNSMTGYNLHNAQYSVSIPQDTRADFANALTSPTIISFYQGEQTKNGDRYVMSVALAGGELGQVERYYITKSSDGTLYYHSSTRCSRFQTDRGPKDPDSGKYISEERTFTMEEAASYGAYPCPDCIH
jgi:hypothetical protein